MPDPAVARVCLFADIFAGFNTLPAIPQRGFCPEPAGQQRKQAKGQAPVFQFHPHLSASSVLVAMRLSVPD